MLTNREPLIERLPKSLGHLKFAVKLLVINASPCQTFVCKDLHMSGFSLNLVLQDNRVSIRWHMTKLQIKSDRITSFGGIYLVNRLFDHFSLGKVINDTLGLRSTAYNGYQWDEIVKSLFDIYLCGGGTSIKSYLFTISLLFLKIG